MGDVQNFRRFKNLLNDITVYQRYLGVVVPNITITRDKVREAKNNENWIKQKVNLNEIVDRFIPEDGDVVTQHAEGDVKYDFEGNRYIVKCDKVAGYLRIYDKNAKSYCLIDGTPSRDPEKTHFKIKRREEM